MSDLQKSDATRALEEQWRRQAERSARQADAEPPTIALTAAPGEVLPSSIADLKIPSLPASTALLIEMCHDINVSYGRLATVIQSDAGLSVRILRIANSAYYAQMQDVSSVVRALTVLGLKEVRNIGLSYSLLSVVRDYVQDGFDFDEYWEKSLLIGVMSREIARQLRCPLRDEAFLAGLLQDIGIVVLRFNKEGEYRKIADVAAATTDITLLQLEQQMFGTTHARIGADVCAAWKFPEVLTEAIRHHHAPPQEERLGDPAGQVHAAAYAASMMPDFLLGDQSLSVLDHLEELSILQPGTMGIILDRAHASFEVLYNLFERHRTHDAQIAGLMRHAADRLKKIGAAQVNFCRRPE